MTAELTSSRPPEATVNVAASSRATPAEISWPVPPTVTVAAEPPFASRRPPKPLSVLVSRPPLPANDRFPWLNRAPPRSSVAGPPAEPTVNAADVSRVSSPSAAVPYWTATVPVVASVPALSSARPA